MDSQWEVGAAAVLTLQGRPTNNEHGISYPLCCSETGDDAGPEYHHSPRM